MRSSGPALQVHQERHAAERAEAPNAEADEEGVAPLRRVQDAFLAARGVLRPPLDDVLDFVLVHEQLQGPASLELLVLHVQEARRLRQEVPADPDDAAHRPERFEG